MSASDSELLALAARWRKRAQTFRHEAKESDSVRDIYRLAGMASSLDCAARELCHTAGLDPSDGPVADNVEADRAILETNIRLARDGEESEP
jgi:hypothetical protein